MLRAMEIPGIERLAIVLLIILADLRNLMPFQNQPQLDTAIYKHSHHFQYSQNQQFKLTSPLLVYAKGVAGLGKAGGDGSGGSDKAGQQVPPEVYNALTYAGTAFLFTLSVPLILYGLNKLLNKIEDLFGCGPSDRKKKLIQRQMQIKKLQREQQELVQSEKLGNPLKIPSSISNNIMNNVVSGDQCSDLIRDNQLPFATGPGHAQPSSLLMGPGGDRAPRSSPQRIGYDQQQHPYIISSPHL